MEGRLLWILPALVTRDCLVQEQGDFYGSEERAAADQKLKLRNLSNNAYDSRKRTGGLSCWRYIWLTWIM